MGKVSTRFKEVVESGQATEIRRELLGIINRNPDMQDGDFVEALKYAENKVGKEKLYESFSNKIEFLTDKSQWDEKYMAKLSLNLRKEFSEKMVQHIQDVAPVAYKEQYDRKKYQMAGGHQNNKDNNYSSQINQQKTMSERKSVPSKEQSSMKRVGTREEKSQEPTWIIWAVVIIVVILGFLILNR